MSYPGGKGGAGAAQNLINMMPPHKTYIELFLGAGSVMKQKRPAEVNIGIEIDEEVIAKYHAKPTKNVIIHHGDALQWLFNQTPNNDWSTLIYADPPYLPETLASRQRYKHKFTLEQHEELLEIIQETQALIMISGYESRLYNARLRGWRKEQFTVSGRDGKSHVETVWMNFPEPQRLHDYRFIGRNYREREKIRRRLDRLERKITGWPMLEQMALIRRLADSHAEGEF